MCEITVVNLHDARLNKKLLLMLASIGSSTQKDGWGIADATGNAWKCQLPMFLTTNSGKIIRENLEEGNGIILGHVRNASPRVPVEIKNSHPFTLDGISFAHNGKLTPLDEKQFVMEEEVPDLDKDGVTQLLDAKTGLPKTRKVNRSDSLIFFEKFLEIYKANESTDKQTKFLESVQSTMALFYGKFALIFIIEGTFYIIKGKTAHLNITYLTKKSDQDSKVLGWVINTNPGLLEASTILLSNLEILEGKKALNFTFPEPLKEETIYVAREFGLEIIGELKENSAPTYKYNGATAATGTGNFTKTTSEKEAGGTEFDMLEEAICDFMLDYSLSPADISRLFWANYGMSTEEATLDVLKHFFYEVVARLKNLTKKNIRKDMKKALSGLPYREWRYEKDVAYPWILNPTNIQVQLVKKVSKK